MTLHDLFGTHIADPEGNHWDNGLFVSVCQTCGRDMVKPPLEKWRLAPKKPVR